LLEEDGCLELKILMGLYDMIIGFWIPVAWLDGCSDIEW
jgi:hypothetical protein